MKPRPCGKAEVAGQHQRHGQTAAAANPKSQRDAEMMKQLLGGLDPAQRITVGPGYQVPFARDIRVKAEIPTGAVGLITDGLGPAEQIVGEADLVRVGLRLAELGPQPVQLVCRANRRPRTSNLAALRQCRRRL